MAYVRQSWHTKDSHAWNPVVEGSETPFACSPPPPARDSQRERERERDRESKRARERAPESERAREKGEEERERERKRTRKRERARERYLLACFPHPPARGTPNLSTQKTVMAHMRQCRVRERERESFPVSPPPPLLLLSLHCSLMLSLYLSVSGFRAQGFGRRVSS